MKNVRSSWKHIIFAAFGASLVGVALLSATSYAHTALADPNQNNNNNNVSASYYYPKTTTSVNNTTAAVPSATAGTTNNNTLATNKTSFSIAEDPPKPKVIVFNTDKISVAAARGPNAPVSNTTCGAASGYPLQINVNGLAPDTTTMWRLVHSNGAKTQGPWGTFMTNGTGGYNEPTYIEELPKDRYHLLFFNSVQGENEFRPSDAVASALVTVADSNNCTP